MSKHQLFLKHLQIYTKFSNFLFCLCLPPEKYTKKKFLKYTKICPEETCVIHCFALFNQIKRNTSKCGNCCSFYLEIIIQWVWSLIIWKLHENLIVLANFFVICATARQKNSHFLENFQKWVDFSLFFLWETVQIC